MSQQLAINMSYLKQDEDLDQRVVNLIIEKYAGYSIYIPLREKRALEKRRLYLEQKGLNVPRINIVKLFQIKFNIKRRAAHRSVSKLEKEYG